MLGFFCGRMMINDLFSNSLLLFGFMQWKLFRKFICQIFIEIGAGAPLISRSFSLIIFYFFWVDLLSSSCIVIASLLINKIFFFYLKKN